MRRVTAISLILAAPAFGGIEHTVLHGLEAVAVRSHAGPDRIPGLTSDGLQAIAEARLRAANIPIDANADAVLWVGATVVLANSDTCFVRLEAQLLEEARLERNGFRVQASSWSSGGIVAVPAPGCAKGVEETEERAIADFIEHYRAMNPARPVKR